MRCAVKNCGNNNRYSSHKKFRFFHFPKDEPQLKKWINFCGRENINTSTSCICNSHFRPEDFERNLQYEMGFTRKNPTKLKSGSFPTINKPQDAHSKRSTKELPVDNGTLLEDDQCIDKSKSNSISLNPCTDKSESFEKSHDVLEKGSAKQIESQLVRNTLKINLSDSLSHLGDLGCFNVEEKCLQNCESSDFELNLKEKYCQAVDESKEINEDHPRNMFDSIEIEIIDPLNTKTDNVEIVDSRSDTYVNHLETEVNTLKSEILILRGERRKMISEIRKLKDTIRHSELDKEFGEQQTSRKKRKLLSKNQQDKTIGTKVAKSNPVVRKTVFLYTADIDTVRKLRRTHNSTE